MQVKKTTNSPTSLTLTFTLTEADLAPVKELTVARLGKDVKLSGFRPGKAPKDLVEKNIDPSALQTEVIEDAINHYYIQAAEDQRLRPISQPEVSIKKFVPFTELEFDAKVEVIGKVKLPDYKKLKKTRPAAKVTEKDITDVLKSLQQRLAKREEVQRAAKAGDQVTIGFKGVNEKGEAVNGAEGKDYPLTLGSNSFIPGFEDNVIGMKPGDEKTFTIPFPKDYGVKALAGKKVTFTVDVTKVEELSEPKLDDKFAAEAGPFTTLADLKKDVKTQLTAERQQEADGKFQQELIEEITAKSSVEVPDALVEEQLDAAEREERQNLMYRGQTWEEHLKEEGVTEKEHRARNKVKAEDRVKASLVLSEISELEKIDVTADELDLRMQLLRGQYQDPAMQAELDKPETRRDIASRLLTEKTVNALVDAVTK
jgi:trigger factor